MLTIPQPQASTADPAQPAPAGYRICARCIMDTSDPGISFDGRGYCNRCEQYLHLREQHIPPGWDREAALKQLVEQIRAEGQGKDYDCIIGVSGGVDSTYTAYVVKNLGLRPLAVHLDNGWDSELAVANIEKCLKILNIDLYTLVLDWDEFRELQLAFLKASTPDSEVPTDHAIYALLKKKAAELGIRTMLFGNNVSTEGIRVTTWSMGQQDWKYIRSVHRRFGRTPLKTFPHITLWDEVCLRYIRRQRMINILNYVDYHKQDALNVLTEKLGYAPYAGKHHESVYTRFYQTYILPRKFGYDKRRIHLSGLIMSGQITRAHALEEMKKPIAPPEQLRQDKVFVCKKLGVSEQEFDRIMALPKRTFWQYPSYERNLLMRLRRALAARRQRRGEQNRANATAGAGMSRVSEVDGMGAAT